jgi:hypothetical protein
MAIVSSERIESNGIRSVLSLWAGLFGSTLRALSQGIWGQNGRGGTSNLGSTEFSQFSTSRDLGDGLGGLEQYQHVTT